MVVLEYRPFDSCSRHHLPIPALVEEPKELLKRLKISKIFG